MNTEDGVKRKTPVQDDTVQKNRNYWFTLATGATEAVNFSECKLAGMLFFMEG